MERLTILFLFTHVITCYLHATFAAEEKAILSSILTSDNAKDKLTRQSRSYYDYYDYRYGLGRPYDRLPYDRPLYDRLEYARLDYDRPRCGRCNDRDDRDDDDYDRRDDDRRGHKPTHGNRYDKKNYDSDEDRYNDRKNNQKNETEEDNGDKKRYDDKDRPSGSRRGDRDRNRDRDRQRQDDRDRYRPDYYDRFLRDRDYYDRPYYDDLYRDRRPFDRYYPDRYEGYGRYDGYGYEGYRRPGYEDDGYGGYGPGVGRGPHDSFRPWDETYRGQAGWDAGGRGYYFASGRPDAAPASAWGRPEYARPQTESGWQNVGYAGGYRDPLEYRGTVGYSPSGYRQDLSASYGQASGWHSASERRPYRDESGVKKLEHRDAYSQPSNTQNVYAQSSQQPTYDQQANHQRTYQQNTYGQPNAYQSTYGQQNYQQTGYGQTSSTTLATSYLFQRDDDIVTGKPDTTKAPS